MLKKDKKKLLFITLLLTCIYFLFTIIALNTAYKNNFLIRLQDVDVTNILSKLIFDILTMYLPVFIFFLTLKKVHQYEKPNKLSIILLFVYLLLSIYNIYKRDLSIRGIYALFYYLGVGFSEEMIFRQYLYNSLKISTKPAIAVIISGGIWGIEHGILPSIIHQYPMWRTILACSDLLGGVLFGLLYIYIMKKTKSVWNCIFIHSFLDFSGYITDIYS